MHSLYMVLMYMKVWMVLQALAIRSSAINRWDADLPRWGGGAWGILAPVPEAGVAGDLTDAVLDVRRLALDEPLSPP